MADPCCQNEDATPAPVPLVPQTLAILHELREITGSSKYLFPSVRSWHRPISNNTLNAALRRLGYDKTELTVHGLRSTASVLLNESGKWHADAIDASWRIKRPTKSGAPTPMLPSSGRSGYAWCAGGPMSWTGCGSSAASSSFRPDGLARAMRGQQVNGCSRSARAAIAPAPAAADQPPSSKCVPHQSTRKVSSFPSPWLRKPGRSCRSAAARTESHRPWRAWVRQPAHSHHSGRHSRAVDDVALTFHSAKDRISLRRVTGHVNGSCGAERRASENIGIL